MSSVKSVNKNRREVEREKKEILKRLHKLRLTHDTITRQMKDILEEANIAGTQLLNERSKKKFWLKLGPLSSIINQSYGRFVNIENHLPHEDDEMSDSSSDSSQTSLNSMLSVESMRSSMSTVGLSVACGASTSNASCQTPIDPKGAGDAKAMKKSSRANENTTPPSENNQNQESNSTLNEEIKTEECNNAVGNGTGNGKQAKSADTLVKLLGANQSSSTESSGKSGIEQSQSVDNTPRAICSVDGFYRLVSNSAKVPLVSYETESLTSDEMDDVPEMVESKQSVSTKHTDNQSALSSASSSNEGLSLSFKNISMSSVLTPLRVPPPMVCVGTELEVVVMDVQSPSDFWVQCLRQENDGLDILISTYCKGPDAVKPGKNLMVGMHCCAWDDTEDCWFRSEVKLITYNWDNEKSSTCNNIFKNVQVRFLDVGTLNTVLPENLRILSKECAKFPAIAMHCKLFGLVPYCGTEWSSETNAIIHNWIHENNFQMTIIDFAPDGMAIVELDDGTNSKGMNIGKRLLQKKLAKSESFTSSNKEQEQEINHVTDRIQSPMASPSEEKATDLNDEHKLDYTWDAEIQEPELPTESKFELLITCINSPTSFYAIRKDKSKAYCSLVEELKSFDVNYNDNVLPPLPECIKVGTFWAARISKDETWHRAKVLDISKRKRYRTRQESSQKELAFLMFFIDYGDKELVTIKHIRPLLKQFCSFPAFAVHLALANIQPVEIKPENCNLSREDWDWSVEAYDKFVELVSKDLENIYFVGKIVPEINETFALNLNAPIPIKLTAHEENSVSINDLLFVNGFAGRHNSTDQTTDMNGIEDDCIDWGPLNDKYSPSENTYGNDTNDLTVACLGYKPTDDRRICHSYNRGLCSDPRCRFEHTVYTELTTDYIPIRKVESIADSIQQGMAFPAVITAVDNPDNFFIALPYGIVDFYDLQQTGYGEGEGDSKFPEFVTALTKYCEGKARFNNPNIEYTMGELLAAKCGNQWYRIMFTHETVETIEGMCIDYGDILEFDRNNVRPLPIDFTHFPSQAVACNLAGVCPTPVGHHWSEGALKWFENRIGDGRRIFLVIVEGIYDNLINATIYDPSESRSINDDMISHGFAQPNILNSAKG